MSEKKQLRYTLLQQRLTVTQTEWREKSDRICTHLLNSALFQQAKTILAYFSFRNEPDLSPLFHNPNYRWGIPRCVGKSLTWHTYRPGDILVTGAFGIAEPHPDTKNLDSSTVDLILVPCVGCDKQGFRLGYGGGFYDRLLASPEWRTKPTIGIVFDFAYLPQLPIESWDQPLQHICTESGFKITH